jgi:response regulator RpfG family c-di-GMP phosphodiesterase
VQSSSVVLLDRANHFTDAFFSVLTDRRFDVHRVTGLEEALATIDHDRGDPPDLLMLNGSGRSTGDTMSDLARLRDTDPDLPILVLTLAPDPALAARVRALGAAGVLPAPWLPRDLVTALERARDLRRRRREAARARAAAAVPARRLGAEAGHVADLGRANAELARELATARAAAAQAAEAAKAGEARRAALDARQGQLRAVAELSAALAGGLDASAVLELVVREAARLVAARGGALRLLDETAVVLGPGFVLGAAGATPRGPVLRGEGLHGWAARTGRPLVVVDASRDARATPDDRLGQGVERIACVPVALRERVLGTLAVHRGAAGRPFSAADVELLGLLAAQAAVAIEQARQARALEEGYLVSLRALVRGVEARDPSTADHSDNVAFFAVRLARAVGLDEQRQIVVRRGAWLHDLGQAFLPPALLARRDRFSPVERALVRDHPTLGYRVLEPIAFLGDARAVVRDHHERYDGAGYPDGRSGESIPVEARIVAVAEAFDSMTRERGYARALSVEAAAAELRAHARTQFDPDLVDRFVELLHRDESVTAVAPVAVAAGGVAA